MKPLLVIFSCLAICFTSESGAQTFGNADVYTYNSAGYRVKREYIYTMIAPKQNNQQEHPVDTLRQRFNKADITVKAYPNPVADQMIVENLSWKDEYKATVKIFDILGQSIQSKTFSSAKEYFSLSGLVPGTYQVQYYLDGRLLTTWKIIKK